jgi:hypothetical protein
MTPASVRLQNLGKPGRLGYWLVVAGLFYLLVSVPVGPPAMAQEPKVPERVFNYAQADVEKALESLQAYETARLPVLAGFVNAKADTLKDYDNPHYQFQIELMSQGSGHTLVQIKAEITAWYAGAVSTRPQYVLMPSNGRLEEEMLDRLSVFLEHGTKQSPFQADPLPATSRPPMPMNPPSSVSPQPASGFPTAPADSVTPLPNYKDGDPEKLAREIATVQSELKAVEQKERQSQQQIAELDGVAKSRQRITDFAIAKNSKILVFEQPSALSKILFHAEAEDEFEVTEAREGWVRVRLDNAGQAWLRISDLELPGESNVTDDFGRKNFSVANEVIQTFTGEWPVLKGKSALFVLAEPKGAISEDTLGKSQLEFAGHTFLEGYRAATHSQQTVAGVVVVFSGDKPGVAAATLPEIRQWQEGRVSDQVFFARCSLDPPSSFRDTSTANVSSRKE